MEDLFENSPEPAATLDVEGSVVSANASARRLGLRNGQALHEVINETAHGHLRQAMSRMQADEHVALSIDVGPPAEQVACQVTLVRRPGADLAAPFALYLRPQSDEEAAGRLLRRMVAHTAGAGQTYFEQLVIHLAAKLGTRWAMIAVPSPDQDGLARVVAFCDNGKLAEPFTYDLAHTPCEDVLNARTCVYPANVSTLFPKDELLVKWEVQAYLGVPLPGRDGVAVGIMVLMHDAPVSQSANSVAFLDLFAGRTATELERLSALAEAERQRDFADRLLDRVGALVLLLDHDGRVLRSNRTVDQATGWTEAALVGRPIWQTLAPAQAEADLHAQQTGSPGTIEQDWTTPDGDIRRIRWQAQAVTDGDASRRPYVLVTGMDLTALRAARQERDRLQESLRQARRLEALGRLAGGVAHDFNNLLLAILGYADLIEIEADPASEITVFANEIRRAGDQAAALTRQLLAFGRRQRLERRQLDLKDVLGSATAILRPLLGEGVSLQIEVPDAALPVVADPGRLEQVVVNLGVNARDAMPDGGQLSMRAQLLRGEHVPGDLGCEEAVSLEITDTGTGIPADVLPHIFEPFFTTKELGRGTGLGLASVYGTVQQHGGTLDVVTQAGEGTTFRVVLPLTTAESRAERRTHNASPAAEVHRQSVLVAEDDPHVRSLVERVLSSAGYHVHACEDGQDALDAWQGRAGGYDLVLADVLMPRLGGVELCTRLLHDHPDARVVLTSGFVAEPERVPEGVRLLQKPYLPDDLLHVVGKALAPPAVTL